MGATACFAKGLKEVGRIRRGRDDQRWIEVGLQWIEEEGMEGVGRYV